MRIDFARSPIDVNKGAREAGRDQRRAKLGHGRKELVHKGVFGFAQGYRIEPALAGKARRIEVAAMGGREDERGRRPLWKRECDRLRA